MPYHPWDNHPSLFRGRQKLRRQFANNLALEVRLVGYPESIEDGEHQQRVFWRLSERFSCFD
jgi:hypothetical protein